MKNKIYVVLAIAIIAILVVVFVVIKVFSNKDEETTTPKLNEGFYSLQSYGSLSFEENEDMMLTLLVYYYNEDLDLDKLHNYHDFNLITEDNQKVEMFYSDEYTDMFEILESDNIIEGNLTGIISDDVLVDNKTVITGMSYKDQDDNEFIVDIGNISIYRTDLKNGDITVEAKKREWVRFELPLLDQFEVTVTNNCNDKITLNSVDFGIDQIVIEDPNIEIEESQELQLVPKVADMPDNYIFYTRPIYNFTYNGESYDVIQTSNSRLRYVSSEKTLYNYFFEIQEENQ